VKIKVVTGKGLPEKYCGMEVIYRNDSRLVFRHYPNEGITFYFPVKKPGAGVELVPAKMEFTYQSAFGTVNQPAYLRLLSDILAGDNSSFASPIEALQALRIADKLEASFKGSLVKYPVGTYPEEAKDWLPSEWG
jgi:glucose-6-phosphate 1-dehydrogenase